jgi:hypothetical protein
MANPSQKLDDLLNDVEINCDPTIGSRESIRFTLDCLYLILGKLPRIAEQGITVVSDYLERRTSLQSVEDTRARCWEYLGQNYKNTSIEDPVVSAIRAVIFPLWAQQYPEQRDIVDHLSVFLELVNYLEPHYEEEEALLRTHFAKCLKTV